MSRGNLWVGCAGLGGILQIDPRGVILGFVPIPNGDAATQCSPNSYGAFGVKRFSLSSAQSSNGQIDAARHPQPPPNTLAPIVFIAPFLTLFEGVSLHSAVACSIVSVIACSCASAAPFLRGGLTNIRVAIVLETATTLGAWTGVFLAGVLPVPFLQVLFATSLLVSAWQMMGRRRQAPMPATEAAGRDWTTVLGLHATYPDRALGRDVSYRVRRVPVGLLLRYGAGLISALLGIGSGVLKIPALDTALRLPIKVSSATSNFMIGVTAAASGVAYFARGDIDPAIAGLVALGSVIGSCFGHAF